MDIIILKASPRRNGNTESLIKIFRNTLEDGNLKVEEIFLYDKEINPCIACRKCQEDWNGFGCFYDDDMNWIFNRILESNIIILATPIYSWYCTAPMKSMMDRLVYGMNKYYGKDKGPSLWEGKRIGLITSSGYPVDKGADLFEEGLKRYAKHSKLEYIGSLKEHDLGYKHIFMDDEKEKNAKEFGRKIISINKEI